MIVARDRSPLPLYANVGGALSSPRKNPPGVTFAKFWLIKLLKSTRDPSIVSIESANPAGSLSSPPPELLVGKVTRIRWAASGGILSVGPMAMV